MVAVVIAAVGLSAPARSAAASYAPRTPVGSRAISDAALAGPPLTDAGQEQLEAFFEELAESLGDFDLDLRVQGQVVALAAMPDAERLGTAEVEINSSLWSVGSAMALGYEHTVSPSLGTLDGGFVRVALQWRFLALVHRTLFRWIDPQLEAGLLLGGLGNGDDSWFRVAGYVGGGLDLRFLPSAAHAVLTVRYRYSPDPLQLPDGLPEHLFVVGIGVRGAD